MLVIAIVVLLFGLVVGSFTGVVVEREGNITDDPKRYRGFLNQTFPWASGRSRCDHCHKTLLWYDNIPLLSYLLLKGKCHFCRSKIPFRHFVIELLMGVLFLWGYLNILPLSSFPIGQISPISQMSPIFRSGSIFASVLSYSYSYSILLLFTIFIFLWALVSITLVDLRFGLISDGVLIVSGLLVSFLKPGLVLLQGLALNSLGQAVLPPLFWATAAALFFIFLVWVTRGRGMGWGDVKLAFWMGLWLGWGVLVALWLAFLTGAAAGIILILLKRKKWGQTLPFGPFLAWGTLVAAFAGNYMVSLILPRLTP